MTNKECIEGLKSPDVGYGNDCSWLVYNKKVIDYAIAQLEMLDKINEHIDNLIDYRRRRAEENEAIGIISLQHRISLDTLTELRDFIKGVKPYE